VVNGLSHPHAHDLNMSVAYLPGTERMRDIDDVEADVAVACGYLHAMSGRLVTLVADVLERELWQQDGVRSPEHWLTWQTGAAHANARRIVNAARRLHELPVTMAALVAGELSLDQVTPIVDRAPAWADRTMCEFARCATVAQIRTAVAGYPRENLDNPNPTPDPEPAPDPSADPEPEPSGGPDPVDPEPEPAGENDHNIDDPDLDPTDTERFTLVQNADGTWSFSGRLDPDHGAIVDAALREIADQIFADTGHRPSRAAALVELARRHHTNITDHARRDRYRVHYLLDEQLQLHDPFGHTLPTWLRDLICCDPDISVTWYRHGTPIAHNNVSTTIDPATRRHVKRRDRGLCRVPGCNNPGTDLHHIEHREHGGNNHPANIGSLCKHHHRLHHKGHLGITGNAEEPDGLTFTNRHGRTITPNQLIRPPTGPPPPPTSTYHHPTGERFHTRWMTWDPPPNRHRDRGDTGDPDDSGDGGNHRAA
jgi:hypothetical protein